MGFPEEHGSGEIAQAVLERPIVVLSHNLSMDSQENKVGLRMLCHGVWLSCLYVIAASTVRIVGGRRFQIQSISREAVGRII